MSTALAAKNTIPDVIEKALIQGDLKDLDPAGRIQFYRQVCESLGLNPLTQPFAYIVLNGKLTLYAKRDCAEQLRKIHGVAVTSMNPQQIGDLFVVTVTAQDKKGRTDSSTGAVNVKGLSGEALANAMMKAETKAKRRVTLSLCGLGLLDETEVETIPDAKPFQEMAVVEPPKTLLTRQLEASLEVEKPKSEQAKEQRPYEFHTTANILVCKPVDVVQKKSKRNTDFLLVKLDSTLEGHSSAYCYHPALFDAVLTSKDKVTQFEWSVRDQWLYIDNILDIDGQEYRDGKPYNVVDAEYDGEITDDDIPF